MHPNESLIISWAGSFATIVMFDDTLQILSGIGTIAFTVTMIIKNIQSIKNNQKDVRKNNK
jgi:energy-converting hydrogenase Eha subunit H